MSSEVEICNLALSEIRAGSINNLDEASLQAQQCKLKYPLFRDKLLGDLPWGFNKSIKPLSLLEETEIFNWAFAYQYPSDCLRINRLVPEFEEIEPGSNDAISRRLDSLVLPVSDRRQQIRYEVFNVDDNRVIGSDEKNLRLSYRKRITDPNLFSDDFTIALSYLLASTLAIPLIGVEQGRQLRSDSFTIYREFIGSAAELDMNEQYHEPVESDFVTVRR